MKVRLAHVGMNPTEEWSARKIAEWFSGRMDWEAVPGKGNYFLGTEIEIMEERGPGRFGHLAFAVQDLERAMEELEGKGVVFDRARFKYDEEEKIAAAYLKEEIGGFAVHLIEEP
ncbi:MAG: VOC family protein [Eubacteriales bacterium]|nr:VOC family protein [Eubacteriales bacterium]